jgi:hypothetical protein
VLRASVTPAPGGVPEWTIGTALKAVAGSNVSRGFESRPLCVSPPRKSTTTSTYRLDRGVALVFVGGSLIVAAVAVFLAFVFTPLDNEVHWIGVAAILVAVAAAAVAVRLAVRPPVVLRLDAEGYRSRTRSEGGLFSGRWLDVEDVAVTDDVLVFSLAGGGEQRLPLGFVGAARIPLLRDIHDRLNTANGYRRFGGDGGI